jgi:plasmid stabilization system protein ParE
MVKKKFPVIWDDLAIKSLKEIYLYIKNDSPKSAVKVKKAIVKLASSLSSSPYRHKVEFVVGNKEYRSVTIWSYKIIYRVTELDVRIVDVFHTSRNPDDLNKNF